MGGETQPTTGGDTTGAWSAMTSSDATSMPREDGSASQTGSDASSEEYCEPGREKTCWETPDGTELPDLGGEVQGECRLGARRCTSEGAWGPCEGAVGPAESDLCDLGGADNDCNGVPNEGCSCLGDETRPCGSDVGNCEQGIQTCGGDVWGSCEGGVSARASDSCEIDGDDANCNGIPNEGCSCKGDETESCGECATRTCDPVRGEWGECVVQNASCTIGGVCYGHNARNPDNPCQYCDASLNQTGWTNASSSTSCDDRLYCNGADTCDGSGACVHEFPDGDRCAGVSGPCAAAACSEETRSCVLPNSQACGDRMEYRCSASETCGASIERRRIRQFCSGASASCDGAETPDSWQRDTTCGATEVCTSDGFSASCTLDVECVAWCSPTDLCWLHEAPMRMNYDSAVTYCNAGTWGGETGWRLPSVDEWISVFRGCANGTRSGVVGSSCEMFPPRCSPQPSESCSDVSNCAACPENQGPDTNDSGCYWESGLSGPCNDTYGYWTATSFMGASDRWVAHPRTGTVAGFGVAGFSLNVKCVAQR